MSMRYKNTNILKYAVGMAFAIAVLAHGMMNSTVEATSTGEVLADSANTAIFAGGCFWCVESDFDNVDGVLETVSGYSGGDTSNPNYKNHHRGRHREVVRIVYDPTVVTYEKLLHTFWRSVDPTDAGGQFCDRGHSYTTAIYTLDDVQFSAAKSAKAKIEGSGVLKKPIATVVEPVGRFWPAEDYHQNYYQKNPVRYKFYRNACRRDARVAAVWGDEAHAGIKAH